MIKKWMALVVFFLLITNVGFAVTFTRDGGDRPTFYEYACGGVPTNTASSGYPMTADLLQESGTNWLEVVHAHRRNLEGNLSYVLETSSNLLPNDWKIGSAIKLPMTGTLDAEYEAVTNRIDTTGKTNEFIRLRIEQN